MIPTTLLSWAKCLILTWWYVLTHWDRMTHTCVGKLNSIASDDGLSPGRHQAIIWTNAESLFIGPLGTNFSEILIKIKIFSLNKIHLKMSSAKCQPFCLSLSVLIIVSARICRITAKFWITFLYPRSLFIAKSRALHCIIKPLLPSFIRQ